MAEPITQTRLRALAAVHPEQGRVLSVFLNLDPAQFATPAARSSAITSVITSAAHKVEEAEGLSHDERIALRDDVERVRDVLIGSDVAANGTRAVAVYACGPEDLLEIVRLRRPVDNRVVLERTPCVEPLVLQGTDETWMVVLANRRCARLFVGPGEDLEETDRVVDDVHQQHDQGGWSQLNYQRSVEKEVHDHLAHAAEVAFGLYKARGVERVLVGAPDELLSDLKAKLHPYLKERIAGKLQTDVENASLDDVRSAALGAIGEHTRKCEREALDRLN
jgi:peptide chain release factor subunit 1